MTDPEDRSPLPAGAGRGARRLALLPPEAARPVPDRQLRQGPRAGHPDHRGGRGGEPPPRRRAHLPARRRRPAEPRRQRRHQPRHRAGPPDLRDRRRARHRGRARARSRPSSSPSTSPTATRSSRSGRPCSATTTARALPEVQDPGGRNNTLWFQEAPDATGEVQQRFHLDIVVPREVAEERVAAAVAAGGTLVSEDGGAGVLGARRRARQQGLRLHRRRPGARRGVRSPSQILGRLSHSGAGGRPVRLRWCHAQGHSCTHATCELSQDRLRAHVDPSPPTAGPRGFLLGHEHAQARARQEADR